MPVCHWLPEAKPCWLSCTTPRRWTDNFTTLLLFPNTDRKGLWKPSVGHRTPAWLCAILACPMDVPLLKPHHMFCTLGMPTSVASRLFERPEHVQVHVAVRQLRLTGMLDERIQKSTAQYSTCIVAHCPAVHDPPPPFPCQPSPCIHIFPSTSALHICTSVGKVTSVAFLFVDVFV